MSFVAALSKCGFWKFKGFSSSALRLASPLLAFSRPLLLLLGIGGEAVDEPAASSSVNTRCRLEDDLEAEFESKRFEVRRRTLLGLSSMLSTTSCFFSTLNGCPEKVSSSSCWKLFTSSVCEEQAGWSEDPEEPLVDGMANIKMVYLCK